MADNPVPMNDCERAMAKLQAKIRRAGSELRGAVSNKEKTAKAIKLGRLQAKLERISKARNR